MLDNLLFGNRSSQKTETSSASSDSNQTPYKPSGLTSMFGASAGIGFGMPGGLMMSQMMGAATTDLSNPMAGDTPGASL